MTSETNQQQQSDGRTSQCSNAGEKIAVWVALHEEEMRQARHHEILRSHSTNVIIGISAAILAFASSESTANELQVASLLLIIIANVYGALMSRKHYERARRSHAICRQYRTVISGVTAIENLEFEQLMDARAAGLALHNTKFPHFKKVRAFFLWAFLHIIVALVGAAFLVILHY